MTLTKKPCGCIEDDYLCEKHAAEIVEEKLNQFPFLRTYEPPEKECCSSHLSDQVREQLIEIGGRPLWEAFQAVRFYQGDPELWS